MKFRPSWLMGGALVLAAVAVLPACSRRKPAEVNAIVPSISFSRSKVPLGSAVEITYTWKLEPTAKKIAQDQRAFVHFLDSHRVLLFEDDHVPTPPTTSWEPGTTVSYTRTKFIPIYPYVGDAEIRVGLASPSGRGDRIALKGDDTGMNEYRVGKIELLPQTENIFLVYKDGWHNPESHPENPSIERTWTKQEALVSFKNPKKDVIVYLEADTCSKCFPQTPVLSMAVGGKVGFSMPIETGEVFLKKLRVKAADLGTEDWVDLRLMMNASFVPKSLGMNSDDRELGLLVYHLYVGEEDKLGELPKQDIVDATPIAVTPPAKTATKTPAGKGAAADKSKHSTTSPAPTKSPAAKSPAPTKSPAPAKSATPEPPKKT